MTSWWRCRVCPTEGDGGAAGWTAHWHAAHVIPGERAAWAERAVQPFLDGATRTATGKDLQAQRDLAVRERNRQARSS